MSINEKLDLEREDRHHESTQARLAGRLKSACCRRCGSVDGMQSVHRDTLAEIMPAVTTPLISWYKRPGNAEYLFYPCPHCNHWQIVPNGYAHVTLADMAAWLDRNPMAPDYAALAAEEPVLASEDSRDSAGL